MTQAQKNQELKKMIAGEQEAIELNKKIINEKLFDLSIADKFVKFLLNEIQNSHEAIQRYKELIK